ncbi:nucleotide sugar dehydrogenase [Lacibacterium aquatile]|uniref:Nucleotide sugar dehydrogenase n=1 Tax=Lacibacterium aquatile TaxID=1168082 RepID=A0ABW5DYP7_9PROT
MNKHTVLNSTEATEIGQKLADRIAARDFRVGIVGLGYVGLPLALAFVQAGFPVLGFDVDQEKVNSLNARKSYIRHISTDAINKLFDGGKFVPTADVAELGKCDAVVICVPTPLSRHREPDLSYIEMTAEAMVPHLQANQLVVLESTTYPGTTTEVLVPILEKSGLKAGLDLFVAFSPEREDPGNPNFETRTIPKVIGADDSVSRLLANTLYAQVIDKTVPVSSAAAAEATKLTENIFRAVNIALVNELKVIYDRMGIDIWEVIDAAKTKPFGFMPFYPGPGLGGHCIPIDPFYLTWKAREFDIATKFIELAGEINRDMPYYIVRRAGELMDQVKGRGLNGAKVLVIGAAYKKNVDDMRESPALRLMELLRDRHAAFDYHDPFVAEIPPTREHATLTGLKSVSLTAASIAKYDAVLIATDHDNVDYDLIVASCDLVIDTRNATKDVSQGRERIFKV